MRVLAASTAGAGHFGPMAPFLRGCLAAGHDVLVAVPAGIRTDGFETRTLPGTPPEILGPIFGSLAGLPRPQANARVMREVFGGANVDATLAAHEALVDEWRPDLVVREVAEVGSYVAATRAGVPHVQVALGLRAMEELLVGSLDGFADRYGVDPAPLLTTPTLSLVPPSMEPPDPHRTRYRDPAMAPTTGEPADELPPGDDPLVYVTYGSVAASLPPFRGVYRESLDALADLPVRILMTTGDAGDPAELGDLPPNVRVVRWAPQDRVLPYASVAVGHGGFGTTFGALAAGVPVAVRPLFSSDQFTNAAAVARAGAGVVVDGPGALRDAVTGLLANDIARQAARALADEIAALPPADEWRP
ncbi:MAG TPA: glycosyltransferase [Frankiaceae bacterium]|nr:glycosyltransferase [Frankiaceae bacterium]